MQCLSPRHGLGAVLFGLALPDPNFRSAAPGCANNEADDQLRVASAIDASRFDLDKTIPEPKPAPPLRQPAPAYLPRVDNEIKVPEAGRACPKCGPEDQSSDNDLQEIIRGLLDEG